MKTEEIKELLEEAISPQTTYQRKNGIAVLLKKETAGHEKYIGVEATTSVLFQYLFERLMKDEDLLDPLLPVFILLCGDKEQGKMFSKINFGHYL